MITIDKISEELLRLLWSHDSHCFESTLCSDIKTYRRSSRFGLYNFDLRLSDFLEHIGVDDSSTSSDIIVKLPFPGEAISDTAEICLQIAHKSLNGKKLAYLAICGSKLLSAKAVDLWAAFDPIAYLNWHILNNISEYYCLEHYKQQIANYAIRNSFLKCPASVESIRHGQMLYSSTLSNSIVRSCDSPIQSYLDQIANGELI